VKNMTSGENASIRLSARRKVRAKIVEQKHIDYKFINLEEQAPGNFIHPIFKPGSESVMSSIGSDGMKTTAKLKFPPLVQTIYAPRVSNNRSEQIKDEIKVNDGKKVRKNKRKLPVKKSGGEKFSSNDKSLF